MKFLRKHILSYEDDSKDCEDTTAQKLNTGEGTVEDDSIEDIKKYVHTILNSDDQEDIECKKKYNDALEQNIEMHILHDKMEILSNLDQDKLEDMIPNLKTSSSPPGISLTQVKMKQSSKNCTKNCQT